MSPKKRLSFVLMLCLLAAFAVQTARAEEAGGICALPALGQPLEPSPTSCTCVQGGSFNCSGTGTSCSAATSSFLADCDDEADLVCSLDGVCFVTIIEQDPCVWDGSQYVVTGRARARCRVCS